jgi:hypothetical protein
MPPKQRLDKGLTGLFRPANDKWRAMTHFCVNGYRGHSGYRDQAPEKLHDGLGGLHFDRDSTYSPTRYSSGSVG